jgi:hypothetical protein
VICAAAVYESAKWPEVVPSLSARRRNARIPPWRLVVLCSSEGRCRSASRADPPAHAWGRQQPSRHSCRHAVVAAWCESADITLACSSCGPVPIEPRALAVCVGWCLTWLDTLSIWACFGTHARAHVNAAPASKTLCVLPSLPQPAGAFKELYRSAMKRAAAQLQWHRRWVPSHDPSSAACRLPTRLPRSGNRSPFAGGGGRWAARCDGTLAPTLALSVGTRRRDVQSISSACYSDP